MNCCGLRAKCGGVLVSVLAVGGLLIMSSNPGCEAVVDDRDLDPGPTTPDSDEAPLPNRPLGVFRRPWNSEGRFDWPVARDLAEMSLDAYDDVEVATEAFLRRGFSESVPIVAGSMVAHVASGDGVVVVVFRGTDDREDWNINFSRRPVPSPHGPVHEGFWNAYASIKSPITARVKQLQPRHVWITGHSLGGALALICAYDFVDRQGIDVTGVMTFGQPMVARNSLAQHLDKVLLRRYAYFVNESDIVPRTPRTYSHCGSRVWFQNGTIWRSEEHSVAEATEGAPLRPGLDRRLKPLSEREFRAFEAEVKATQPQVIRTPAGERIARGNVPFIKDHSMDLYLQKVVDALAR